jgi:hypothetical protein
MMRKARAGGGIVGLPQNGQDNLARRSDTCAMIPHAIDLHRLMPIGLHRADPQRVNERIE